MAEPFWAPAFDITERIVSVNKNSRFIRDRSPFLPLNDLLLRRLRARTGLFISDHGDDESCPGGLDSDIHSLCASCCGCAARCAERLRLSGKAKKCFGATPPTSGFGRSPIEPGRPEGRRPSAHQAAQPRRSRQMTMTANNFG